MVRELEEITIEDLDEEQQQLADTIGLDAYKNLIQTYGGTHIYIQKSESYEKIIRNRKIIEEFNGYNVKEIALKYRLTETQIRSIVKEVFREKRNAPAKDQISIFDLN